MEAGGDAWESIANEHLPVAVVRALFPSGPKLAQLADSSDRPLNTEKSHEASCCFADAFACGRGIWPYTPLVPRGIFLGYTNIAGCCARGGVVHTAAVTQGCILSGTSGCP